MSGPPRLPGRWVDGSRPVAFRFEGRAYTGLAGDSIASALAASGVWLLSRSFKYHRPRGVLSMAGHDANTLVQVGGAPNVPADCHPISEGLEVRAQNYRGSLERDRDAVMGRLARFMPVGFYYKAFFRPFRAWRFWEPIVRRRAGLGAVDPAAPERYHDKAYGFCDVAVAGGGAAGLAAALAAAHAGAEVVLVDDGARPGGALAYERFDAAGSAGAEAMARLAAEVEANEAIRVLADATCTGCFADHWLSVTQGDRLHKLRARAVVVATGSLEQPIVFRNNDLPGVMLGSAAQRLIRLYGVRPGRRAVVVAGNDSGYGVALDLDDAGVEVAAVADLRAAPERGGLAAAAADRGIPLLAGHAVHEALPDAGGLHLGAVRAGRIAAEGRCDQGLRTLPCDLLCMSAEHVPAWGLPLQAGARFGWRDGAFRIDGAPPGLHLAGAANGAWGLAEALADGQAAGLAAAAELGLAAAPGPRPRPPGAAPAAPWPIFAHPQGKEFVDMDEDLQRSDIVNAVADGYAELELVKRYSTVGMGPSQGRHSAIATARLVARASGRSLAEVGVTTARPPYRSERLGVLAGRRFEPERLSPIHHRHLEAGAQLMTAGLWWRPAFYGPAGRRDELIREEVLAVRRGVGLIDVSTLGKLEVRGPAAAELLNRLYTYGYAKQPAGRSRYLLMCNEAGFIVDDGVACRLGPEHFYVTATTGGGDRVYRDMLWWNAQWRLAVDVTNASSAYGAVNIAGPQSRRVLAPLAEGLDLSAEGFPYLAVREGRLAGIPCRLMRVGFVGELCYEIHAPAGESEALWDALMAAGAEHGIRPVGVEAQRVLRLEKGHIIVGQDTDAMTTPVEGGLAWAVSRRKPFFVGGRSLELRERHPPRRRLVGFTLDGAAPPEESSLVLDGDRIAGYVTSVAHSPSLGRVIGLAFTDAGRSGEGDPLPIELGGGSLAEARVAPVPFYDPENARQAL